MRHAVFLPLLAVALQLGAAPRPAQTQESQPENQPPVIQHAPPACAQVQARPRICAYVVDETGIAQVRVSFRARGARAYHWTATVFDGALFCAWLPAPLTETRALEYYLEAVDDQFEPSRTIDYVLEVRSVCPAPAQQPPQTPAVVGTTVANQPPSPPGFDPTTFTTR